MKVARVTVAAALAAALAGCEAKSADDVFTKQNVGMVLGGITGAVIGAQFGKGSGQVAAAAAGTLIGAFVGREIGKSMTRADQAAANQAQVEAQTAPVGQPISWSNPESGNSGTVTPTREGKDATGNECREYRTTVTIGGKQEDAYGTACRQPDGSWRVVN